MKFGEYLQGLREEKGWSVNQLAMYSGVSASLISRVENNKRGVPKPETIKKLADALKTNYDLMLFQAGYLESEVQFEGGYPYLSIGNTVRELSTDEAIAWLEGNVSVNDREKMIEQLLAEDTAGKEEKENDFDSLTEITAYLKGLGVIDMGFFNINDWKDLSRADVEDLKHHFDYVLHKARERQKSKKDK